MQLSTKVELLLNLKAAKALGLAVPVSLLGRADEALFGHGAMSELSPLCAAKRMLIWRPIGGDVTFMRQPAPMRLTPKVFSVAGLALGKVVDRRHDRLHQDVAAWHCRPNMLRPRAEMPHSPKRSHELRWIGFRVVPLRPGHWRI